MRRAVGWRPNLFHENGNAVELWGIPQSTNSKSNRNKSWHSVNAGRSLLHRPFFDLGLCKSQFCCYQIDPAADIPRRAYAYVYAHRRHLRRLSKTLKRILGCSFEGHLTQSTCNCAFWHVNIQAVNFMFNVLGEGRSTFF